MFLMLKLIMVQFMTKVFIEEEKVRDKMNNDIDFSVYEIKKPKEHYVYAPKAPKEKVSKKQFKPQKCKRIKYENMDLSQLKRERQRLNRIMDNVYEELLKYNAKLNKTTYIVTRKNLECRVSEKVHDMKRLKKRLDRVETLIKDIEEALKG